MHGLTWWIRHFVEITQGTVRSFAMQEVGATTKRGSVVTSYRVYLLSVFYACRCLWNGAYIILFTKT